MIRGLDVHLDFFGTYNAPKEITVDIVLDLESPRPEVAKNISVMSATILRLLNSSFSSCALFKQMPTAQQGQVHIHVVSNNTLSLTSLQIQTADILKDSFKTVKTCVKQWYTFGSSSTDIQCL